jgi:hypothetical protein
MTVGADDRPAAAKPPAGGGRGLVWLVALLLFAALVAQVLPPLVHKSGVCDEHGAHLPAGYVYWKSGVFSGGINNPPLMQLLTAAPLAIGGMDYSPFSDKGIWAARLPVLFLSLGLGLAVLAWARSLYGRAAGLAALFLFCFEPNVLAHSGLATLDLGVAAFLFVAFFFLWRTRRSGRKADWTAACAAMSLALLSKFTAVFLLPLFLILLFIVLCRGGSDRSAAQERQANAWRSATLRSRAGRGAAALVFFALIFVGLSHALYHLPAVSDDFQAVDGPRAASGVQDESVLTRAAYLLLPDLYVGGALGKLRHSTGGHFAYLMGERSLRGWWYYFPVALSVKTPIPFLAAFVLALILRARSVRRWGDYVFVLLPMAIYVCAMAWTGIDIGVRHVLLFYPAAAVIGSGLLAGGLPRRKVLLVPLAVGAAWYLAGTVRIHPDYLAYFNEIAGGPMGGPRYLIDSNIDWGQDENLLVKFIADQPDTVFVNPGPFAPSVGTIAVNVNSVMGILRSDDSGYGWLRQFEPDTTLGYTWYVYRLTPEDFERAAGAPGAGTEPRFWYAIALKREGRLQKGLAELESIADEFPDLKAKAYLTSGRWLLSAGRHDEAIDALAEALRVGGGADAQAALEAARAEAAWVGETATGEDLARLGRYYAEHGETERAEEALRAAIESDREDVASYLALARLLGREAHFGEAAAYAEAAARLDPDLTAAGQMAKEARELALMESREESYGAMMTLAQFHSRYGRPAAAAWYYWRAFKLSPSSEEALTAMGDIIVRVKLGVLKPETPWPPWRVTPKVGGGP